ncbi:MAG: hypothetical protein ACR2OX_00390 [Methyloligellaceae bacterium]
MRLRSVLVGLICLFVAACDDLVAVGLQASKCEVLAYPAVLSAGVDEFKVWAGNREGFAAAPLLTSTGPDHVKRVANFFLKRRDGWYMGAGETYNPASRRAMSEFTIEFLRDGKRVVYIGWGYNYLETPGCGFEAVRVLPVADRPVLFHALFGSPLRS